MAETIVELLTDVADAIREKKGISEPINAQSFADEIRTIESSGNGWTGHADAEGLRAIGWDDEDIAYYQNYGVNWNEEDDQYHKVSDDNKALYGVLTADNIQTYKDRIVYLPKIDTSARTTMQSMFYGCNNMIAIPMLDTSNVTNFAATFRDCKALVTIPPLELGQATSVSTMFYGCYCLETLPPLNTSKAILNQMLYTAHNILSVQLLDVTSISNVAIFYGNYRLRDVKLKNLKINIELPLRFLSKNSLLFIIENEIATSAITITLHADVYQRLRYDADVEEALANHNLIELASA